MAKKRYPIPLLLELRKKAVYAVVKHGMTQVKAAAVFGFNKNSMSRYTKDYRINGDKSFHYEKRGCKEGTCKRSWKMEPPKTDKLKNSAI